MDRRSFFGALAGACVGVVVKGEPEPPEVEYECADIHTSEQWSISQDGCHNVYTMIAPAIHEKVYYPKGRPAPQGWCKVETFRHFGPDEPRHTPH